MAYVNLSFFSLAPTAEVMPPAKAAARKALDHKSSEANPLGLASPEAAV